MKRTLLIVCVLAFGLALLWLLSGGEGVPSSDSVDAEVADRGAAPIAADMPRDESLPDAERVELQAEDSGETTSSGERRFVRGQVRAPDDTPIEGATVRLLTSSNRDAEDCLREVSSDAEGGFAIALDDGWGTRLRVWAKADGFMTSSSSVTVGTDVTLSLPWATALRGRIREAGTGTLLAAAMVATREHTATTDSNGAYELPGIPVGKPITVRVRKPGYASHARTVLVHEREERDVDFELLRGVEVSIVVLDYETRTPVLGAAVYDRHIPAHQPTATEEPLGRTDSAGRFTIRAVPGEKLELGVAGEDYCATLWYWPAVEARQEPVVLPAMRLGWIEGTVRDEKGAAVAGADVYAHTNWTSAYRRLEPEERVRWDHPGEAAMRAREARAASGQDGRFRVPVAPGGEPFTVAVRKEGLVSATQESVEVPSHASPAWVDLVLERAARVRGRVMRNGEPWRGRVVWQSLTSDDSGVGSTDASGNYELSGVRPGKVRLTVQRLGAAEDVTATVVAKADDVVERDLEIQEDTTTISGRVTDSAMRPLSDISVFAHSGATGNGSSAKTAEDGTYSIEVVTDEVFTVVASRSRMIHAQVTDVPAGTSGVDLELADPGYLRLRLLDAATGEPVDLQSGRRRRIGWRPAGDLSFRSASSLVDIDGVVAIETALGPVDVLCDFSASGYVRKTVRGLIASPEESANIVDVTLSRGVAVKLTLAPWSEGQSGLAIFLLPRSRSGDVRAASPTDDRSSVVSLSGVDVWIRDRTVRDHWLRPDADGNVHVRGLAPGDYVIRGVPDKLVFDPAALSVSPETRAVEIRWNREQ